MVTNPSVSIIIPNFNGKNLLEKNLTNVIEACQSSCPQCQEIIIVDDGSTDDSVQFINSLIPRQPIIKLITNRKNGGFSSAANQGVKSAHGEIVVLLNSDIYPEKGFIETLLPHFKDPQVFGIGMMDKSVENGQVILRGRGVGWWQRGFYVHQRGEVNQGSTDWVSGGSGAFRKSIFLQLGGFAVIYNPFYWEDIDLSYRARQAGFKILFEPRSVVTHEHEKGTIKKEFSTNKVILIAFRNQFLFVWRNANFYQWLVHLLWLPYHLIFSTVKSRGLFLLAFLWAIIRALSFSLFHRQKYG